MDNHYEFHNQISSLCKTMDESSIVKGPVPRWQRKAGCQNSSLNNTSLINRSNNSSIFLNKTPGRSPLKDCTRSFLDKSRNQLGQNKEKKTPSKLNSFEYKNIQKGDRFIPSRNHSKLDTAWHMMQEKSDTSNSSTTFAEDQYRQKYTENLEEAMGIRKDERILSYSSRPLAVEGYHNRDKVLFSSSKNPNRDGKKIRHIPTAPEKVLDAPDLKDDFYLNLLDWSKNNTIAVGLGSSVYLWDATSGGIQKLLTMEGEESYISSVKWTEDGYHLAVGDSCNAVQLWDVEEQKRLRNMKSHEGRINTMSWNEHLLTSGSLDSNIHHHDVRVEHHLVNSFSGHSQEVCAIEWSPDGNQLASGGNDNLVNIYDYRGPQPLFTFTDHLAAVKALAWCPWHREALATGGGTADRQIRLWNTSIGECNKVVDSKSQVCMLKWSTHYKELLSSHGYSRYQLSLWSYPDMTWMKDLVGHTARVLYLTLSPDGQTICSAGGDETLRLWKCFEKDSAEKKRSKFSKAGSLFGKEIR